MAHATNEMGLELASSPHLRDRDSVPAIMYTVAMALLPCAAAAVYFFGIIALLNIAVCVGAAMLAEWLTCRARGRPSSLRDGSAVVTGLLLALVLPPRMSPHLASSLQIMVVGAAVSIVLGKMIYGGLGFNVFNPALIGRAFLMACYPVALTTWTAPSPFPGLQAVTGATPLGMFKFERQLTDLGQLFWGNVGGSLGETSAVAVLLGAAFLFYRKVITWHIPVTYLGTVVVFTAIMHAVDPAAFAPMPFHLLSGGLFIGAFFMATDMVTSPTTHRGQLVFGIGGGLIVSLIRLWGGYPEGVMYSILFMNAITPLINRWTVPTIYGHGKGGAA
ncbi:RnfABCDGE type electron transport complex subunit D [Candidatus Fermentibacteria bacterium]|nr:RnfABCDGE type electron transport complex subunit D [Candidatus Fermentibacteria bacterium]